MNNPSINRALAAMQLAKEQKEKNQQNQNDAANPSSQAITQTSKTEIKPAFHQNLKITNSTATGSTSSTQNKTDTKNETLSTKTVSTNKPSFVRVDISVAGTPHRISCPTDDVANLKKHSDNLNHNLREIRRQVGGKSPNNEELLVLHCLELYDEIQNLKTQLQDHHIEQERSHALIDKLIKETQSILV